MVFLRPTPSLKITQLNSTQPKPMDFDDHDEEIGDLPVGGGSGGGPTYDPPSLPIPPVRKLTPETPGMGFGHRKPGGGRYRECQKNHAVNLGGHAVDGCGEFMPAGEEGTLDGLKCAACNCHRNFHRKDADVGGGFLGITAPDPTGGFHHHHHQQQQFSPTYYRTPGYLHHPHAVHQRMAPAPLALPSTSDGGGSRDEQEGFSDPVGRGGSSSSLGKKRFRTRFTQEQKDKMLELAERLGWRMQKHDEGVVQQFCAETGVQRHVLKVWMHNNKHTLGKAPPSLVHHPPPPQQQQPVQDRDVAMEDGMPG